MFIVLSLLNKVNQFYLKLTFRFVTWQELWRDSQFLLRFFSFFSSAERCMLAQVILSLHIPLMSNRRMGLLQELEESKKPERTIKHNLNILQTSQDLILGASLSILQKLAIHSNFQKSLA
jgi:hypothetical protein